MNVLVTGANGFIGKNLICALQNVRDKKDKTHPEIEIEEIYSYDITSETDSLDYYCKNADFVFNLAGVNRPENEYEFIKGNVLFSQKLIDLLNKYNNKCPIVVSSSIQAEFDNPYGKSKIAEEQLFFDYSQKSGVKVLIYRFPNVFGKWCKPNYNSAIATFCYNVANDLPISVTDAERQMTLTYIDDLVEEMFKALSKKETRKGIFCEVPVCYQAKLGFIADTIKNFPQINSKFCVPNLENELVSKLYSTYLSYLPKEKLIYDLKMNSDERGAFAEFIRTKNNGQFSINVSKPGVIKGEHWHNSKNEKFLVVKGTGCIQMRKIGMDNNEEQYPVISFDVNGTSLQVVEMIPGYTHRIINLSDNEDLITLIWANECFDPDRPDTFKEEV